MTEYSVEEVRVVAKRLRDDITVMDSDALAASDMLDAYADLIELAQGQGEAVALMSVTDDVTPVLQPLEGWRNLPNRNYTLYTAKPRAVPDGWVLVPKEPTEAMLDAAMQREDDEPLSDWGKMRPAPHAEIYKAMLTAAQQADR